MTKVRTASTRWLCRAHVVSQWSSSGDPESNPSRSWSGVSASTGAKPTGTLRSPVPEEPDQGRRRGWWPLQSLHEPIPRLGVGDEMATLDEDVLGSLGSRRQHEVGQRAALGLGSSLQQLELARGGAN